MFVAGHEVAVAIEGDGHAGVTHEVLSALALTPAAIISDASMRQPLAVVPSAAPRERALELVAGGATWAEAATRWLLEGTHRRLGSRRETIGVLVDIYGARPR